MVSHHAAENAVTTVAGTFVVAQGVSKSMTNQKSMLSSSISQIIEGDFLLYGSDITTLIGSIFLIINVWVGIRRWQQDHKERNKYKDK